MNHDVRECPACGNTHQALPFVELQRAREHATHAATCPIFGDPILMRVECRLEPANWRMSKYAVGAVWFVAGVAQMVFLLALFHIAPFSLVFKLGFTALSNGALTLFVSWLIRRLNVRGTRL